MRRLSPSRRWRGWVSQVEGHSAHWKLGGHSFGRTYTQPECRGVCKSGDILDVEADGARASYHLVCSGFISSSRLYPGPGQGPQAKCEKNTASRHGLEKAVAPHSSTFSWKIPWMEEPGRLQSYGVEKSQTRLSGFTFTFHFHALEKEMATRSSVLAWGIPGMVEPGGLLSMG